jgi:hypothetical protein
LPRCLLTLVNQRMTTAIIRRDHRRLSDVDRRVVHRQGHDAMSVANPLAKLWIAGTTPARAVEFAGGAGSSGTGAPGTAFLVAFTAAFKIRAAGMPSHRERR